MLLNIVMIVFNMIPAFPMDGGRVLRAMLASSMGLLPATRIAVTVGTVAAILMGFAGAFLLGNPWLVLIAVFVILAGIRELRSLEMELAVADNEMATSLTRPTIATNVTICFWDAQRQQWVRRTVVSADGAAQAPSPTRLPGAFTSP